MNLLSDKTMGGIHVLLFFSVISLGGAEVQIPVQVVPQGIESRNGSDVNMGCASPPAGIGDVMLCGTPLADVDNGTCGNYNGSESYMVDCNSPAIDTSTSNWASQLVTARKNKKNDDTNFDHVVLTFYFDTAVSPTAIELDLFLCPEWNIGAPYISVYAEESKNTCGLVFSDSSVETGDIDFLIHYTPKGTSCDSLTNVSIPVQEPIGDKSYFTWHIVVSFGPQPDIEWVYVGEVRFVDVPAVCPNPSASVEIPGPSSTEMPTPTTTTTTTIINSMSANIQLMSTHTSTLQSVHTTTLSTHTSTLQSVHTTTLSTHTSTLQSVHTLQSMSTHTTTLVHTTALQSVFSSKSPTTTNPPSSPDSTPNSNTTVIAAGVVAGLIALVLLVTLVIVIYLCKKYRRSQVELEKQNGVHEQGGVELKDVKKEEYKADNPLYITSETINGHQATTTTSPLYDSCDNGGVDNPTYNSIVHKKVAHDGGSDRKIYIEQNVPPIYSGIEDKAPPSVPPKSSQLLNKIKTENEAENVESVPIYSDVHKEKTPDVPPKSPDLEVYLSTHDTVSQPFSVDAPPASNKHSKLSSLTRPVVCMKENPTYESADAHSSSSHNSPQSESNLYALPYTHKTFKYPNAYSPDDGIYSEAINPSDFTCGGGREMEKEEDVLQIYAPIYTDPTMLTEVFQPPVEVTSDNIQEVKELGTGQFGQVVLAATDGLSLKDMRLSNRNDDRNISVFVAVKKLKSNASKPQREAFDKEVKFMSRLKHPNVVYFLGVCYDDPAFIMMEHMEEGDLNQFLQRYSEIVPILTPSDNTQITTSTVVNMASQIASAMQYLASLNFVHRDLASRNCLVGKDFTVKLSDFGMSRNLYGSHYYRIQGNAVLPIRWMATECFYGKFSEKTDVWAFGITMWELFTLAKEKPYPNLSDQEVINDAIKGAHRQLLPKPAACPQSVYRVMQQCWVNSSKTRATFQVLFEMLLECTEL